MTDISDIYRRNTGRIIDCVGDGLCPPVNAVNYCSGSDTQNMKADRNENVRCAFRDCRNKSCFALLSIRKEITHGIPVDTFRLQADRSWKIAVVSVHSAKQQITGLLC